MELAFTDKRQLHHELQDLPGKTPIIECCVVSCNNGHTFDLALSTGVHSHMLHEKVELECRAQSRDISVRVLTPCLRGPRETVVDMLACINPLGIDEAQPSDRL